MISVIIPVYNSQEYLKRCISSVLAQTYKNFEIILVDDNSLDESLSICNLYQKKDPRIQVIHNETTKGAGAARNVGLAISKGEYIVFIDSDDWVEPTQFEYFIDHLTDGIDTVIHNYTIEENGKSVVAPEILFEGETWCSVDIAAVIACLDKTGKFNYLWNRVYKKSIIEDNSICFEEQFITGQDLDFNCKYFTYVNKVCISNRCLYHYMKYGTDTLCARYKRNLYEIVEELGLRRRNLYEHYGMFNSTEYSAVFAHAYISHMESCIPNMYRVNAPYKLKDKIALLRQIYDNENIKKYIKLYEPVTRIEKLFTILYKLNCASIAAVVYSVLFAIRNNHSDIYQSLNGGSMKTVPVSVMIPTMNRPNALEETIEGYLNADVTPQEIIVVDQSSDEIALGKNKELVNKLKRGGNS